MFDESQVSPVETGPLSMQIALEFMGVNPHDAPTAASTLLLLRSDTVVSYFSGAIMRDSFILLDCVEQLTATAFAVECRDAALSAVLFPARSELSATFANTCQLMTEYLPAIAEWYTDEAYTGRAARVKALCKVLASLACVW